MIISIFGIYFNIFEIALLCFLVFLSPAIFVFSGTRVQMKRPELFEILIFSCALYLVVILISIFVASSEARVLKGFFKWVEIFGFSMLIFIYIRSFHHFKIIYWMLLISTISLILVGIINTLTSKDIIFRERIIADYPSTIALGLLLPFALRKNKPAIFLSILFFGAGFLSLTRGAWLVLFIYTILLFKEMSRKKKIQIFGIGGVVLVILFFATPLGDLVKWRVRGDSSNAERIGMARVALKAFSENPLIGIGNLNFPIYLASQDDRSFVVATRPELLEPHNMFLQVAAEEGIFGLVAFITIICTLFYIIFKEGGPLIAVKEMSPYLLGMKYLTVPIMCILFFGFISDYFRFIFILFMGLSMAILRLERAEPERI